MSPPTTNPPLLTRSQWNTVLARYREAPEPEHRRTRTRRAAAGDKVELIFVKAGRQVVRSGTLMNVSSDGLLVRTHPIPGETAVRIRLLLESTEVWLAGQVRHCTETVGACKVGIRLDFTPPPPTVPGLPGPRR